MINDEIRKIIEKLNYYTKLYDEGHPEISDKEYDDLYFQLQKLEQISNIYYEDSPTQRINYQVVNKLNKVKHNHWMGSLDKTKDINEICSFIKDKSYIGMAKLDGLTCSLRYVDGKLISAETRGNGEIGEDILHNALHINNIPKKINYKGELIVDGEVICTYDNFKYYEDEYKNPRNFASGSIRLLDSKVSSVRNLTFVAWDVINDFNRCNYLSEKLYDLRDLGFTIVPLFIGGIGSDINDLEQQSNFLKKESEELSYPIDGLVYKIDNIVEYEKLGHTDHHFKGGIAYKFYDEEYETELVDIEWSLGRTGQLTPVVIFKPVEIDGTTIERASLFNVSVMLDVVGQAYKGEKLWIYKANQITPQVSKADKKDLKISEFRCNECPVCGNPTELKNNDGILTLYCGNPICEGKLVNKIEHLLGKRGLDAHGISKATIEKLVEWGWVKKLSDMFALQSWENEWKNLPGFGKKSVSNILKSIHESSNCDLESIISGAGIPLIGKTVAKVLSKKFSSWNSFREACGGDFDFSSIEGFGYEMNKSLKNFDYTEIDYIVENYLTISNTDDLDSTQITSNSVRLDGIQYCITGTLSIWANRNELIKTIENLGGKVTGSVTKNTNFLINNAIDSTSAKNNKAKDLGISIITEQMFADIIHYKG